VVLAAQVLIGVAAVACAALFAAVALVADPGLLDPAHFRARGVQLILVAVLLTGAGLLAWWRFRWARGVFTLVAAIVGARAYYLGWTAVLGAGWALGCVLGALAWYMAVQVLVSLKAGEAWFAWPEPEQADDVSLRSLHSDLWTLGVTGIVCAALAVFLVVVRCRGIVVDHWLRDGAVAGGFLVCLAAVARTVCVVCWRHMRTRRELSAES